MSKKKNTEALLNSLNSRNYLITVGEKIRQRREECGLSQQKLAEKTGLTIQCISYLELGNREPRALTLLKIALVLSCSTDYLLRDDPCIVDFVVFFSRMGKIDPDRIGELFEELERFIR